MAGFPENQDGAQNGRRNFIIRLFIDILNLIQAQCVKCQNVRIDV